MTYCSIAGCTNPVKKKLLCDVHYQRGYYHGDPNHPVRPYRTIEPSDWAELIPQLKPLREYKPRAVLRKRERVRIRTEAELQCKICNETKAGSEFPKGRLTCFKCWAEYSKRRHLQTRERRLVLMKARRYKTDAQTIVGMHAEAEHCAICFGTEKLCIDHCHQVGTVREILCEPCNSMLGFAREDPAVLRRAAEYVEHHKRKQKSA